MDIILFLLNQDFSGGGGSGTTIPLEISWDYPCCIQHTYRVQGKCEPSSDEESCSSFFIVNVVACSVEEVCQKLQARGFVRRIERIDVFDAPLNGPFVGDLGAFTDVTPTLDDCQECCQFLG